MPLTLPEIPEAENTPLVRQLLEIIRTQQDRIQQLEDEILRLKGLKTRPVIAPSPLERPPRPPREPGQKRPGSAKRSKTAQLVITDEVVVPLADVPPGSAFKRLRRLRGSGSGDPPAGHPLPPRTLAESRRPEPGGPPARRCPTREPLRIDPDQFHHLSVSLPARHPAIAPG